MDNEISIIDQGPTYTRLTLDTLCLDGMAFLEGNLYLVGECPEHPFARPGANYEVIGKRTNADKVEKEDVLALLLVERIHYAVSKF